VSAGPELTRQSNADETLKTDRIERKTYRTRNEARADVFDYIERFYNATRRHSTIGYLSPVEFERKVGLA
jgi:putative transposase